MRTIAIIAILAIALMFVGGWLYFSDSQDKSELILDKQKVQEDAREMLDAGKDAVQDATQELKGLGNRAEDAITPDEPAPEEEEPSNPRTSEQESTSWQWRTAPAVRNDRDSVTII
ncbi:MAG: hypothetical protein ACYC6Y_02115 [Thermoguttaceae bacterium]